MNRLTDHELIEAVKERLDFNRRALNDLRELTLKLEATNRKLQESETLKSHFLSNIRNEINNPLAAIIGLARQLSAGGADAAMAAEIAQLIYVEAFQLDYQLQNIFAAAELEAGETVPECARIKVADVVDGALDSLRHQADNKEIRISCSGSEDLDFITDAAKLRLMIINLLANAVEFSPLHGEVEISFGLVDGFLQVAVRDNGPGIAPADYEAAFDRFTQLDSGSTKSHRGHGLGLSIVRAMAQLLGGRVVLGDSSGEGTRLTIALPPGEVSSEVLAADGSFFLFDQAETF